MRKPSQKLTNHNQPFMMFDSARLFPASNFLNLETPSASIRVHQSWVRHNSAIDTFWARRFKEHNYLEDEQPRLIIVTAMVLHALTMSGRENGDEHLAAAMRNGSSGGLRLFCNQLCTNKSGVQNAENPPRHSGKRTTRPRQKP